MLHILINHFNTLAPGTTFTFRNISIKCFGRYINSQYLISKIQEFSFKGCGYILLTSTALGANLYKKT